MPTPAPHTLTVEGVTYETTLTKRYLGRKPFSPADPKKVTAYIPGVIRVLNVGPGSQVAQGERLLCLEAMKMENVIRAPQAGTVRAVHVQVGTMVSKGALLVEFE